MDEWEEEFQRWLINSSGNMPSSAETYSRNVRNAFKFINWDPTKIITTQDCREFFNELNKNYTFREEKYKNWRTALFHFGDYIEFKENESLKIYSWEIVNKYKAIKKTDKSFFEHAGSGIPAEVRRFFNVHNLERGGKKEITLFYKGESYGAHIVRESGELGRTRIFWKVHLKVKFHPFTYQGKEENIQYAEFYKLREDEYTLTLVEKKETFDITEEQEQEINEVIQQKYKIPNTPEEANLILNQISADQLNQPVKVKRQTGYALSRNPRFARLVKKRAGYVCEICGVPGFKKKNGELYAEAHHLDEIAISLVDNPFRMICVCPTCHMIIHHGAEKELTKRKMTISFEKGIE